MYSGSKQYVRPAEPEPAFCAGSGYYLKNGASDVALCSGVDDIGLRLTAEASRWDWGVTPVAMDIKRRRSKADFAPTLVREAGLEPARA